MLDLIVVGGGPVGLATAIFAAGGGFQVALAEKGTLPRDKACGEGIMPAGVGELEAMRLRLEGAFRIEGIRYLDDGVSVEARLPGRGGWGIRRLELSRGLVERARELGVRVLTDSPVRQVSESDGTVAVDAGGTTLRAGWLVAADGLHSPIRKRLGLEARPFRRGPRRYGIRCHYRVEPWSSLVEVYWARGGEAYVTPVGPCTVGVSLLWAVDSERRTMTFDERLTQFPELELRLRGSLRVSSVRGAGAFRHRARAVRRGRIALVGDAAGFLDAVTGEGITRGLLSAHALAGALVSGAGLDAYARVAGRLHARADYLMELVLFLTRHPGIRRGAIRSLSRHPEIFRALVAWAAEGSHRIGPLGNDLGGSDEKIRTDGLAALVRDEHSRGER